LGASPGALKRIPPTEPGGKARTRRRSSADHQPTLDGHASASPRATNTDVGGARRRTKDDHRIASSCAVGHDALIVNCTCRARFFALRHDRLSERVSAPLPIARSALRQQRIE
jgi:hypothetical protein